MGERPRDPATGHLPYLMGYAANPARPGRHWPLPGTISPSVKIESPSVIGSATGGAGCRPPGRYVPQPDEMAVTSLDQ